MLFNSIEFIFFLPIVFLLFWFVFNKNLKVQNVFVVAASYFFYGWWDWRFLSLIVFSSLVDYLVGLRLAKTEHTFSRRLLLFASIAVNLGFLGFFKYFNFFSESFVDAFTLLGRPLDASRLNIILPVGISFYTFQTLSYTIDVYKRKITPTKDIAAFFAFVSFFPQLVAGPIERASNLLPQFLKSRTFSYKDGSEGLRLILWGLFKKMVVADNCAIVVDRVFEHHELMSGSALVLGAVLFAFQIYGDFSGYSDIAIGTARLFGIRLMVNFRTPYFSRDIAEFWRRWHISLSTWFRDYLYIPIGGSKGNRIKQVRNVFIVFVVSGFWHGANWTFIIWGLLNALYFLPLLLARSNRSNMDTVAAGRFLPTIKELLQMGITFSLTCVAWIFFRAQSITDAIAYVGGIFSHEFIGNTVNLVSIKIILILIFFLGMEWILFRNPDYQKTIELQKPLVRYGSYAMVSASIFVLMVNEATTFIYFQF